MAAVVAHIVAYWLASPHVSCFVYLKVSTCRREELQCIGSEWAELRQVAEEIDAQLRGRENKSDTSTGQFRTLIHGDSKAANILFGPVKTGDEPPECALYDFQYCGGGYGVKDVVYLLVSSVDARVLQKEEQVKRFPNSEFLGYWIHIACISSTKKFE